LQQRHHDKDLYKFPTERTKGIIATIIFHLIIVLVLVISGFKTPLPIPEEEGIIVNFGYELTGSGLLEPAASSSQQEVSAQTEEGETEAIAEIIEEVRDAAEIIPEPEVENLTQDFEEAPVVEKKIEQPDPEVERKRLEELEAERIRLKEEEEERIKKAEEEAERVRKADEDARIKKEAEEREQRRIDINNRTRTALSTAEGTGTNTKTGQGVTGGDENQGKETGSVDSNVYDDGRGTGTDGIGFDLAGREMRTPVKPIYEIQEEGRVVVQISVDSKGNVTQARLGKGSTTLDEKLLRLAIDAAKKTKFDPKQGANIQTGTITYFFKLSK
jgi:colicin import membrane protein